MTVIDKQEIDFIRKLLKEKSGIDLSEDKGYLINSRLLPVARSNDLSGISELIQKVQISKDNKLTTSIIEALTTNETLFFRDNKPFDIFKNNVINHLVEHKKTEQFKIWCAACSSGQEPYSLAMTIDENADKFAGTACNITATDIDTTILKKAEQAIYNQFEIQRGLPITHLMKYFIQSEHYSEKWKVKDELRNMIKFKYLNLLDSYLSIGKCDVIFCRNVLIYFDQEEKTKILNKIADQLHKHGILFLGSSEAPFNFTDKFKIFNDTQGVYQLA